MKKKTKREKEEAKEQAKREVSLCAWSVRSKWRHAYGPPPLIIGSLLISTNEPRAPSIPT